MLLCSHGGFREIPGTEGLAGVESFLLKIGILLSSVILLFSKAHFLLLEISWASLVAQLVKNLPAIPETLGSVPALERSLGEGNGYPLQYSCLENSMECIEILHGDSFSNLYGMQKFSNLVKAVSK